MSRSRVSINIVNWNRRRLLETCLRSVIATAPELQLEIIVVDNGSTDGSTETIRTLFPHAQLIENDHIMGFAAAHNQAILRSTGQHELQLDSDAVLRGALDAMLDVFESTPPVDAVGARLVCPDGVAQASCSRAPTPLFSGTRRCIPDTLADHRFVSHRRA